MVLNWQKNGGGYMTTGAIKEFIKRTIDEEIRQLDFYIYYKNNLYKKSGLYYGPEIYSYEDDVYYSVRVEVNRRFRLAVLNIIMMCLNEKYIIPKERIEEDRGSMIPLDFIIERKSDSSRIGYGLRKNIRIDNLNLDNMMNQFSLSEIVGVQLWESDEMTEEIYGDNDFFKSKNYRLRNIYMRDFFAECIDESVYDYFLEQIERYYDELNDQAAIKVIPVLSSMYLPRFYNRVEKEILKIDYQSIAYQFLKAEPEEDNMKWKRQFIERWSVRNINNIEEKYIAKQNYKIMLSEYPFAKSFATSEWLYYSIDNNGEFDFTSIVTGYLKSIEQLLYYIMQLDIDKNKYVSIKPRYYEDILNNSDICVYEEVKRDITGGNRTIKVYEPIDLKNFEIKKSEKDNRYYKLNKSGKGKRKRIDNLWIPFKTIFNDYINDTMGDYIYFIKNQSDIIESNNIKFICNIVDCFRDECRNGFFHTHMIDSWEDVKKIRTNALYIYFLIFGSITKDIHMINEKTAIISKLRDIAYDFRKAIDFNSRFFSGKIHYFPERGSVDATIFLKRYLQEKYSIKTVLKMGEIKGAFLDSTHAWLETSEGLIIDITVDQYKYMEDFKFDYKNPVYIGEYDRFHECFENNESSIDESEFFDDTNKNYEVIIGMFDTFFKYQ